MKLAYAMTALIIALMAIHPSESPAPEPRGRVIGIGGVFFGTAHPKEMHAWYQKHLGLKDTPGMGVVFPWTVPGKADRSYRTTWALFPEHAKYFEPSKSCAMINYVVDDLDAILERLKAEGVQIDPKRETDEAGRFAWIFDGDGNKIELWEPAAGH